MRAQLTDDVLNGRPLTPQAVDGLRYETVGGRVSVKVVRDVEVYGGYARDRNNRDDAADRARHDRRLRHATCSTPASTCRARTRGSIARPGPIIPGISRSAAASAARVYVSGDYSTSLAVVRFLRSDGVTIETRPWTRRLSGNVSATLNRQFSLIGVVDYTMDEGMNDLRVMTGPHVSPAIAPESMEQR